MHFFVQEKGNSQMMFLNYISLFFILTEGKLMNIVKKALAISAIVLTSFSASATLINVGGIIWDPDDPNGLDFSGGTLAVYQQLDLGTGELSGYGRVGSLNGSSLFCSGCELTFQFDGYFLAPSEETPFLGQDYFTGGSVRFYVDFSPEVTPPVDFGDPDPSDPTNLTFANTGGEGGLNELWLELAGHVLDDNPDTEFVEGEGITFIGNNDGTNSVTGTGALNVIGGLAMGNMVSDTLINSYNPGIDLPPIISFSDFTFGSTFSVFGVDPTGGTDGEALGTSTGLITFAGESIPEPSTLAIFALGLIALALRGRSKRS